MGDVPWPADTALMAILRSDRVLVPTPDDPIESGDELVLIAAPEREEELQVLLAPHEPKPTKI